MFPLVADAIPGSAAGQSRRFARVAHLLFAAAGAPALPAELSQLVAEAERQRMSVGLAVADVDSGDLLFEHNADEPFNPASVTKVVTTVVALKVLGPSYGFTTDVLRAGNLEGGVVSGDLVVRGKGDPSLTLERVWRLASLVRVAGVREVRGDLVIDDGYFDAERTGSGYDEFDADRAYAAPLGAVSATWNSIAIVVRPGGTPGLPVDVALDPPTGFVRLENRATTSRKGHRRRLALATDRRTFTLSGTYPVGAPEKVYYRPIDDPPAYFGALLRENLAKEGVTIHGTVRQGTTPAGAIPLVTHESEPLGTIVRGLNKLSNNFTAEQLLKAVGAERYGTPGTRQKGLDAVAEFLGGLGIPAGSYSLRNGSGLARDHRLSPRLFLRVLQAAYDDFSVRGDFLASLGIAGRDGTMSHRMVGLAGAGKVRGKTGTVDGSTCLAGYAHAANGRTLAFAVLMNRVGLKTVRAQEIQDRIGSALAAWSADPAPVAPHVPSPAVRAADLGPLPSPSPEAPRP